MVLGISLCTVTAQAQNADLKGVVTAKELASLEAALKGRTVVVIRKVPPPKGFTVPGGGHLIGKGWLAENGRVVTSDALVAGWPERTGDVIEVLDNQGVRHRAAVGIREALLGLAVLDVPEMEVPRTAAASTQNLEDSALWGGRNLYGLSPNGSISRFTVGPNAIGPWAYYRQVLGPGVSGTPLVDSQGRLVSFVVRRTGPPLNVPLMAPTKALRELYKRGPEWLP